MTRQEARKKLFDFLHADWLSWTPDSVDALQMAIDALGSDTNVGSKGDMIYRQDAIRVVSGLDSSFVKYIEELPSVQPVRTSLRDEVPSAIPDEKYEYHYDHTDCIWYRPEARNRCPVTCAQYRDGWNDAMNYIFRDGKGYRPYRRDEKYEG